MAPTCRRKSKRSRKGRLAALALSSQRGPGGDGLRNPSPVTLGTAAVCCMSLTVQAHIWPCVALGPGWAISGAPAFCTHSFWSQGNKSAPPTLPGAPPLPVSQVSPALTPSPLVILDTDQRYGFGSGLEGRARSWQPLNCGKATLCHRDCSGTLPGTQRHSLEGVLSCNWAVPLAVAPGHCLSLGHAAFQSPGKHHFPMLGRAIWSPTASLRDGRRRS